MLWLHQILSSLAVSAVAVTILKCISVKGLPSLGKVVHKYLNDINCTPFMQTSALLLPKIMTFVRAGLHPICLGSVCQFVGKVLGHCQPISGFHDCCFKKKMLSSTRGSNHLESAKLPSLIFCGDVKYWLRWALGILDPCC